VRIQVQEYRWGAKEMIQVDEMTAERAAEDQEQRMARVMELRRAIREGSYDIPSWAVASRMLEHLRWP
jgi:anti-sigma28 factor (negative regulator of flagellin synthesis)